MRDTLITKWKMALTRAGRLDNLSLDTGAAAGMALAITKSTEEAVAMCETLSSDSPFWTNAKYMLRAVQAAERTLESV
jgi:hypothetical protein